MVDVIVPGQDKVTYVNVKPEMVGRIVAEHIVNGRPVETYTIGAAEDAR
jgi:NADP-reducing hydrogenase subunit HndB